MFTSQRTRLNLYYSGGKITSKLVLQDVRIWGNQRQLVGNEDYAVSIHEAWAQQARSHDLLLAKYEGTFKLHFGLAYLQSGDRTNNIYYGPDAYKSMQFLWFNKIFGLLSNVCRRRNDRDKKWINR